MGSITALGLVLLVLMIIVGGKQGITSFLSMVVNFGILFFYDCSNCLSSPTHYCDNCFQRDFTFNYNFFGAVPAIMLRRLLFKPQLSS